MHDTDSFARVPALDSMAEQSPLAELLLAFEKEVPVTFKDELFRVRDNGAVMRCARPQRRRRPLDDTWTFGTLNHHTGYPELAGHVVHRIVATAFHGPCPSPEYVVDHIDTNRQNNRADNLRWVTRLENILLNPITRTRIELEFGSLEAFFENPGASFLPNMEWMRAVTKEQAAESRKRLLAWAQTGQNGRGGQLGEWVYQPNQTSNQKVEAKSGDSQLTATQREGLEVPTFDFPVTEREVRIPGALRKVPAFEPEPLDTPSLTASAFQRKWRTPTEFPQCPSNVVTGGLQDYFARLVPGAVFARTQYSENLVVEAAIGPDSALSVVCCSPPNSVKGWTRAKVYVENEMFCHESGGTFFEHTGALKAHCIAIGAPYEHYGESIDDYC
jgi:hypothetical protein